MKNGKKMKIIFSVIVVIILAIITALMVTNSKKKKNTEVESKPELEIIKKEILDQNSDDIKELYTEDYKEYLDLTEEEKSKAEVIPRKYTVKYEELDRIIEKELNGNSSSNLFQTNTEKLSEGEADKKNSESKKDVQQDNNESNSQEDEKQSDNKQDNNKQDNNKEDDDKTEIDAGTIPKAFDLRDYIKLEVENQKGEGLCWAFASLKCVETNLALTQGKYYNFSEAHVNYLTSKLLSSNNRELGKGAHFDTFVEYYINVFDGFVNQNKLLYSEDYSKCGEALIDIEKVNESVYDIVNFPSYENDWTDEQFARYQNTIKLHIMNYGSLYSAIYATEGSRDTNIYYKDADDWDGKYMHAISLIGWDDNYSKENFKSTTGKIPEKDGAYIFLNSWGKEFGNGGYGYISYCDAKVYSDLNGVVSTNKKDLVNVEKLGSTARKYIYENLNDRLIDNKYIKKSILESIRIIDLSDRDITELDGLEVFTNLNVLNISNNKIKNVSSLVNLGNLITLDISGNKEIENLNLISNMANLKVLGLEDCNLTDLSTIKNENITSLNISNNKNISNYGIINEMPKLEELEIRNNNIEDISNTDILYHKFNMLDLSNNVNLTNISKLNRVRYLKLSNCGLHNVDEFSSLRYLEKLDISNNNIKDITPLENIDNLQELNISGNKGVRGDFNKILLRLIVDDCGLDNNFNYFNARAYYISCKNNNIHLNDILNNSFSVVSLDSCTYEDIKNNMNISIKNTNVYKTIKVPAGKIKMYINDANKHLKTNNIIKSIKGNYVEIELNKNGELIIEDYTNESERIYDCNLIYSLIVDESISPTDLQIKHLPNNTSYLDGNIDYTGLKVSAVYDNRVFKEIYDFETIADYEFLYGVYNITVKKDELSATFPIFYDNVKTLKFKDKNNYDFILAQAKENNFDEYPIETDESTLTIKINGAVYKKVISNIEMDMEDLAKLTPIEELDIKSVTIMEYSGNTDDIDREKIVYVFPKVECAYSYCNNEDINLIENGNFIYKDYTVTMYNKMSESISIAYTKLDDYIRYDTSMVKNIDITDYRGKIEDINIDRICQIFKNVKSISIYDKVKDEDVYLLEDREKTEEPVNNNKNDIPAPENDKEIHKPAPINQNENSPKETIESESIQIDYKNLEEYRNKNTDKVLYVEIINYTGNYNDIDVDKIKEIFKNVKNITTFDNSKNEDIILL